MTASIARMNLVLHGVEDFDIQRGDTLDRPLFTEGDRLRTFDVILANPPYSIKRWNREAWSTDAWGRNFLGTPPQARADYAFFQHILRSMDPHTGRCAVLFPHGVLFRKQEAEMRRRLVETDLVDCVLGLGPELFFNSAMESCVVFCASRKPDRRKGRVLFIDAVEEIERGRAHSVLTPDHQRRIRETYERFEDVPGFASIATINEIAAAGHSLSISLYVRGAEVETAAHHGRPSIEEVWAQWETQGRAYWEQMDAVSETLSGLLDDEEVHV